VVTVTSTLPADPFGETAVIWPSESTVKDVACVDPKNTLIAPLNLAPVIVTDVPPAVGPLVGLIELTAGGSTQVTSTGGAEYAFTDPPCVTISAM
jgi:hypothetical protein